MRPRFTFVIHHKGTVQLQIFDDINASHAATGYPGRTDLPDFHIFTVESTYPHTRAVMPPYTMRFYQVVLLENSADAHLHSNTEELSDLSNSLTFASPEHVLSWVRGAAQRGYIIYFKPEFMVQHPVAIQDDFQFFRLTEINLLRLTGEDCAIMHDHCARLLATFERRQAYRAQMLYAYLLALLFECKRLYDIQQQQARHTPARQTLTARFQQFINQHFLTHKSVQDYAAILHVSADYLGQSVKAATGKTAHSLIAERVLLEAKKLLQYSDLSVAEIADHLGYGEATHFGRFFRQHQGLSPHVWRSQRRENSEMGQFSPETG